MNSTFMKGYWGEPTATIDWCEKNYEYSHYIAEFWNTLSNFSFIFLGLYGLKNSIEKGFEWRFHSQFIAVIITGIGSAMFHGTLQVVIYIVFNREIEQSGIPKSLIIGLLASMGVGFAIVHAIFRTTTAFQIFFASLSISCVIRMSYHYRQVKNPQAKAIAVAYVRNSLIGLACWLCDYHLCRHIDQFPLNPQGHAWWHLFMGLACYHGPAFMLYVRQEELSKKPSIVDTKYGKFFGVKTITLLPITQKAKAH